MTFRILNPSSQGRRLELKGSYARLYKKPVPSCSFFTFLRLSEVTGVNHFKTNTLTYLMEFNKRRLYLQSEIKEKHHTLQRMT